MTQYQQVLAAVEKIGGKGTIDEIYNAIDGINEWGAKDKRASVFSYLSRGEDFTKDGNDWVLEEKQDEDENTLQDSTSKKVLYDNTERGLYFITLNYNMKPPLPGLLFKIGKSDGRVKWRVKEYSASLPYNPIQELGFYRIPIDIDLQIVESQVRGELLGNNSLGFSVEKFIGGNQNEWLHTLDLFFNSDDINKLAFVVNKIVRETIDNLRKSNEGS